MLKAMLFGYRFAQFDGHGGEYADQIMLVAE